MTFICILVPRTIFDLNFLIKISFQGCPEPFYYTKENTKKYKGKLHLCIFQLLRQKCFTKAIWSNWLYSSGLYGSIDTHLDIYYVDIWHMSSLQYDIYWKLCHMSTITDDIKHLSSRSLNPVLIMHTLHSDQFLLCRSSTEKKLVWAQRIWQELSRKCGG